MVGCFLFFYRPRKVLSGHTDTKLEDNAKLFGRGLLFGVLAETLTGRIWWFSWMGELRIGEGGVVFKCSGLLHGVGRLEMTTGCVSEGKLHAPSRGPKHFSQKVHT